jgi:outer membrane receptor protein involved in Fe transport
LIASLSSLTTVILLSSPPLLFASGTIRGKVTDRQTGQPLIGANVVLVGTSLGAATNPAGEYSIINVPVGGQELKATYVGHASVTMQNIVVNNDLTTEVDFELPAEAVMLEGIIVVAERPLVNKGATNALRIMTGDEIEAIPVRGVDNLLALTPGVVYQDGSIHIRGGRVDEVGYYLEGVSITDPQYGGRGLTMVQEALEEISVQSGGYEAEYGRANSGIIQHQLKTGGREFQASAEYVTDNIAFSNPGSWARGRRRLGTYWFGYNEFTGTVSSPLVDQRVRLFGLINYSYKADQHPSFYPGITIGPVKDQVSGDSANFVYPPGILLKNSEERYLGTATLTVDFYPLTLRFSGSYAKTILFVGGAPYWMLDLDRVPEVNIWDGFGSLKATYFLGPKTFVEISGGLFAYASKQFDPALRDDFLNYGDSVANAAAGYVWTRSPNEQSGRYYPPRTVGIYNFFFQAPGGPISDYERFERKNLSLNAVLAFQLGNVHTVKVGGDYQRFELRTYRADPIPLAGIIAQSNALPDGDPQKRSLERIMIGSGVENYGFDVLGNKTESNDYEGPRHPVFASAYVQDKAEYDDLTVNLGLRYDYINTNAYIPIDPTHLELTFNRNTLAINPSGVRKTTPYYDISPRLGVAFPVSDQTVFHVQYAKLMQQSRLRDVNYGLHRFAALAAVGGSALPIGYDLRPTRTTQYEIGFSQQIGDFASFDVTAYYKDIKDQIVLIEARTARESPFTNYTELANGDFATTKGIEITFSSRRFKRVLASASLSFQDARGTGSFPNSNLFRLYASEDTTFAPQYISPLDYMNAVRGNFSLDYRFGRNEGGPILQELGAAVLFTFTSGHPFTRASTESAVRPIEPLNASTTPWTFQIDLRLDKTIRLSDHLSSILTLYVINLLDTKNVQNVFRQTGSPDDDGYLSNPSLGGQLVADYGPRYAEFYRALSLSYARPDGNFAADPYMFGPPRQIRLGIKLEY